ncbi:MAG: hypothetical protein ACAH80_09555 [Alphaproteobacteria bacterium]
MAEIIQQFNEESTPVKWSDGSYRALATWWADHLPGAKQLGIPKQELDNIGGSAQVAQVTAMKEKHRLKIQVTQEQYDAFVEALIGEMKQAPRERGTYVQQQCIKLNTDYHPCEALANALKAAGIGDGMITLPWKTSTTLFEDGQAFAEGKVIDHPDRPKIPQAGAAELDFKGCNWYRDESRYLLVDIPVGQKIVTGMMRWGKMEYREETVDKEGQVLVIFESGAKNFDDIVVGRHLFDQSKNPDITFAMTDPKSDYTNPEGKFGQKFEKVGDAGHYRSLGKPFRAKAAVAPFFVGDGRSYQIVSPGDFLTCTVENGQARHEVVKKEWLKEGARRWLASDDKGNLIDPTTTGEDITALKPLKINRPGQPA